MSGGSSSPKRLAEALEAAGAPEAVIEKYASQKAQYPEVQPCNQYIVELFFRVQTQWEYAGMTGARTGLSYPAVEVRAQHMPGYRELSVKLKDKVWLGLQVIEKTVLAWQAEQQKG